MKIIYTIIFLSFFSINLFAQIDTVWEKSFKAGNNYSWFSANGNTERGLAYGKVEDNERLYIVSRTTTLNVYIIDANDGNQIGTLNQTGVTGGTFLLNDIEVTEDGAILAINLTTDASTIKIYKWTNEATAPTVVFQSNLNGVAKRVGDNFKVIGKVSDNSAKIWFTDQANKKVYVLGTSDFGQNFNIETTVTLPANAIDNMVSVYPIDNQTFVMNGNGKNVTKWDINGTLLGTIPGSQVGTGSNSIEYYQYANTPYIFTFQHGTTTENARVVMVGDDFSKAITYVVTPSMYVNNNPNGTGDIDIRFNNDGSQTIFVLSTNNGVGAYKLWYPFLVNGRINEKYDNFHPDLDNNSGFGPNINIDGLYAHIDDENLYIASDCYLNSTSSDGIALFIGVSKLAGTGATVGTSLGNVANGGHLFGATANGNFKNDFETHYGFVINPGSANTSVFMDAVKYNSAGNIAQYIGSTSQTGTLGEGPEADGIFINKSIKFAFYNDHDVKRGWELKIPLNQIGSPTNFDEIKLFAVVVSSTAYFSDITVPGTITGGNLGFDPNFLNISGGPFHMNTIPLPVELVLLKGTSYNNSVIIEWQTASELNNLGFYIERSIDNINFANIGFIPGKGNSVELNNYKFVDYNIVNGKYFYRLKQVDFDGSFSYSNIIEINANITPSNFELFQNYPNPFNPGTTIGFTVKTTGFTLLTVYNSLGQEIKTLYNGIAEPNKRYQIYFDASNFSSGVYYYKLSQENYSQIKKMLFIK
ncbi:MAG TPA: T9SS type A sorting domain-containing protein [Melioribacteraceae bacterium]|nr:T9SS type A sorting domain-containing protein [Melioribacteraceae bacterium]